MEKNSSSSRTIEITVLSAEDLRLDGRPVEKKNVFAIVRIDSFDYHRTKFDAAGGSYPSWNEKLVIDLPFRADSVTLEVHYRSSVDNDRLIGTAKLPVSDFIGGYVPPNQLNFLSYVLKDPRGICKIGIINVSVRVKKLGLEEGSSSSQQQQEKLKRIEGWSQQKIPGIPIGEKSCGAGVVTGVPVWSPKHV